MTLGYGISGIGYSPLGNLGLGMTGAYASYDAYMPSMMGMNGSLFGMGGMMGTYPSFMMQMQNAQNQMELSRLQHAGNMQAAVLRNEVAANRNTDSALISKMLTNGDIQQGIQNLYNKVREGDQDGICNEFDKLKTYVYNTYRDDLKARGDKINPAVSATEIIEKIYANIITAQSGGELHDLRSDITRYGDHATMNGFMQGFRTDHHSRYVDETLNHCFGLEIDQKGSKDFKQNVGKGMGRTASVLEKGVYGAVAGAGAWTLGSGLTKLGAGVIGCGKKVPFMTGGWWKWGKWSAGVGALLAMVGDIVWQATRDKN